MKQHLIIGLFLIVLVLFIMSLSRNIRTGIQSGGRLQREQNAVVQLQQENTDLKQKLEEAKQPDYVERIARDQLNMALPGEQVIVLPKSPPPEAIVGPKALAGSNWHRWYALFFH